MAQQQCVFTVPEKALISPRHKKEAVVINSLFFYEKQ